MPASAAPTRAPRNCNLLAESDLDRLAPREALALLHEWRERLERPD